MLRQMKWSMEELIEALQDIGSWPLLFKIIFLIFTGAMVLGMGYKIDVSKQLSTLKTKQKEEQTLRDTIEMQQQLVTTLEGYKAQIKEMQQILQQCFIYFPQKSDIPSLLETLSQSAEDTLVFRQIKLLPESHTTYYGVQPIEISMKGTYEGLTNFIEKIANASKMITLHDFVIRPKVEPTKAYLQMTLEAKLYYLKGEES